MDGRRISIFAVPNSIWCLGIRVIILSISLSAIPSFVHAQDKSTLTSDATLSISNGIYDVFVQDLKGKGVGLLTVRTGEKHPATIKAGHPHNVLFGGVDGRPGTSFMTVRSYTTKTDYVQSPTLAKGADASDFSVQSLDGLGTVTGSQILGLLQQGEGDWINTETEGKGFSLVLR